MDNWQEWRGGTNRTTPFRSCVLLSPVSGSLGLIVRWQIVSGRNYFLERSTNLGALPDCLPLATNIVGQPSKTRFTDTNAIGAGPFFYRVGVQE
jgi:hypothetical protein